MVVPAQPAANASYKLLQAVTTGNLDKVKQILEKDKAEKELILTEVDGITRVNALHVAAARNLADIVELLLKEVCPL